MRVFLVVVATALLGWSPIGGGRASATTTTVGYWLESDDGGVFAFGGAPFLGSGTQRCTIGCRGIGATADGLGYWIPDAAPGGLLGFGSASDQALPDGRPGVAAVAAAPSGAGAWMLLDGGAVVPFGGAAWFGDAAGLGLSGVTRPPFGSFLPYFVGIASTPDGGGYWLAGEDGGVFAYGDAAYYGSMGGHPPDTPVAGIARTNDGRGYWLVSWDGGVFAFGDARFQGTMAGTPLNGLMIGIAADPDGSGYWTTAQDGGVFAFGDAPYLGSMVGRALNRPVFGIAARS